VDALSKKQPAELSTSDFATSDFWGSVVLAEAGIQIAALVSRSGRTNKQSRFQVLATHNLDPASLT
jgi:hypothetical protein